MNKKDCSFSIVMTVYDQARQLEVYLPAFLAANYEPGYEVIVVDESSTDDTDDVLKLLKQSYPQLYTTFLPKPNPNVTRRKLALSIGIKAAKNEWVIMTDIENTPDSSDWLSSLAEVTDSTTEAVAGYFTKKGLRLETFEDVSQAETLAVKAERRKRKPSSSKAMKYANGCYDFIAVRRSKAYDLLKYFEHDVGALRLLRLRMSILASHSFS